MPLESFDITIIGAGVVGGALARRLSRYSLRILLLEAKDDVAGGAARANSGIIHGGYAAKAGTRKAEFCLSGNRMFHLLSRELDFPFRYIGSVVAAFGESDFEVLENLRTNGIANGVEGLEICDKNETLRRVPRLNAATVQGGLFCSKAGIVSPYEYVAALTENAMANGVQVRLDSAPTHIEKDGNDILVAVGNKVLRTRFLVNAAGAGAEEVAALMGPAPFRIIPRKGQYIIFRRGSAKGLDTVVFQPPGPGGKGTLVTPTTWGNLMVGPDAKDIQDPQELGTDSESLAHLIRIARRSVADFDLKQAIRVFAGVRPAADRKDFILEWSEILPGCLHMAGIESPGLTASPALAEEAVRLLVEAGLELKEKRSYQPNRRAPVHPGPLGSPGAVAKAADLPEGHPERIVCRCEQILETTIRDALDRGLSLRSTDAVKRRTRAGMGACQGEFCQPRVRHLVAQHGGLSEAEVLGPSRDRDRVKEKLDEMRRILAQEEI